MAKNSRAPAEKKPLPDAPKQEPRVVGFDMEVRRCAGGCHMQVILGTMDGKELEVEATALSLEALAKLLREKGLPPKAPQQPEQPGPSAPDSGPQIH